MKTLNRILLISGLLLGMASGANAACNYQNNHGLVKRIYPSYGGGGQVAGTYFTLGGPGAATPDLTSPTGYYFLPQQQNYSEMHNLLMESAKAGKSIFVRTHNCGAAPVATANVMYLVIDF